MFDAICSILLNHGRRIVSRSIVNYYDLSRPDGLRSTGNGSGPSSTPFEAVADLETPVPRSRLDTDDTGLGALPGGRYTPAFTPYWRAPEMPASATVPDLATYVRELKKVVGRDLAAEETVAEVTALNKALLGSGFRLSEEFRRSDPSATYTRNLIHQDPNKSFAVMAIVWGPFQETAIHDHLNWCVMSILEGTCHCVNYDRLDDESNSAYADLVIRDSHLAREGDLIGLTPPSRRNIHKIANAGRAPAITLHTYGNPGTRARIFDPKTGLVAIQELEFHNV